MKAHRLCESSLRGVGDLMRLTWPEVSREVEVPFCYLAKCPGLFKTTKKSDRVFRVATISGTAL